jgi:hypothetical protein
MKQLYLEQLQQCARLETILEHLSHSNVVLMFVSHLPMTSKYWTKYTRREHLYATCGCLSNK